MLKSMTGFGRATGKTPDNSKNITVEIKSVNNRFLDISVRLPRSFSYLEEKVKNFITESGITRGKIEISINIEVLENTNYEIALDPVITASYIKALEKLRDEFQLKDDISVMRVANYHDIFTVVKAEEDIEKEWQDVLPILSSAVNAFIEAKTREGKQLETDLYKKIDNIKANLDEIAKYSENDVKNYMEKLKTRIESILSEYQVDITEQRILTEAAIFADRIAIDEEIVRLHSHFEAFDKIVNSKEPAGRKLDFLLQEMNRETNTIGSKANDINISKLVVENKNELEKIREQIQNIE